MSSGMKLFNDICAHCHGHDTVQSERRTNLRLLQKRYGSDTRSKFWTTVREGRVVKGMPSWKNVLNDEQVDSVYSTYGLFKRRTIPLTECDDLAIRLVEC